MEYKPLDAVRTGARIREIRMERHLRVSDISEFMGFTTDVAVYKWQSGKSMPTIDNLYALSQLFGVTMDEICRGREEDASASSFHFLWKINRRYIFFRRKMVYTEIM
ncbi:MAG: helix-turn-helix domain-containing protein [Acetatifactor muris]|nr:helix-turn-helix domain-containing protein [Acetatifactor muris]MCM1526608.1 helix-turn-helix domain-containing protein [Bacteroides sp.]